MANVAVRDITVLPIDEGKRSVVNWGLVLAGIGIIVYAAFQIVQVRSEGSDREERSATAAIACERGTDAKPSRPSGREGAVKAGWSRL